MWCGSGHVKKVYFRWLGWECGVGVCCGGGVDVVWEWAWGV